jgi:7,8-dihydropterin-6-yl-methyl-4-(beta-D-ribofuranosyl)aminobenzene 5'-phosphate synthase
VVVTRGRLIERLRCGRQADRQHLARHLPRLQCERGGYAGLRRSALQPTKEKVGVVNGLGCFPDKMSPAKNTGAFIPDDFEHEIATNFLVKGKGLVVLTSCSHRGIINAIKQTQAVSGIQKTMPLWWFPYRSPAERRLHPRGRRHLDYLIPGHCSGDRFYDLARTELGDKVIHSAVGTRFVFTA